MTDRISYLTVALEEDIRSDELHEVISAIEQLRGVLKVQEAVADPGVWTAEERVRREFEDRVWAAIRRRP